jgi:hypothetical protein
MSYPSPEQLSEMGFKIIKEGEYYPPQYCVLENNGLFHVSEYTLCRFLSGERLTRWKLPSYKLKEM